jgi:peptidoglycan/xylan/chitin deacetylase (PgdA/CDA1 family)
MTLKNFVGALAFMVLACMGMAHAATFEQNLVPNPGFQSGTTTNLTSWVRGGYGSNTCAYSVVAGASSTRAGKVTVTNWNSGDCKWAFGRVSVVGSGVYRYRDTYIATKSTQIVVEIQHVNGTLSWELLKTVPSRSSFTRVSVHFQVPKTAVRATVYHVMPTNGALTVDNVSLQRVAGVTGATGGMVTFALDDNWESQKTCALPRLNNAGMLATWYVISDSVAEGYDGYMTPADIVALARAGHEIGNHTKTHADLTTLSSAQIDLEIRTAQTYLTSVTGSAPKTFAFPYGALTDAVVARVTAAGIASARTVEPGFASPSDPLRLRSPSVTQSMALGEITGLIDQAIAEDRWLILTFHEFDTGDEYSMPCTRFAGIISHLIARNMQARVVTVSGGLARFGL